MKKRYYCKQNAWLYIVIGLAMLIPLILSSFNHSDYLSVEYFTIYISIVFFVMGAFVFAFSSAHISLSPDYIVFYIIGIPFKNISIHSLNKIEGATKLKFHLFALAKEQVTISYDNNHSVNLSLYKNDEFMYQVNQLKASKCLNQQSESSAKLMRIVRFVIVLLYMTVNVLVPSGIIGAWSYSLYFLVMMSGANIICLAFYLNTIQHWS